MNKLFVSDKFLVLLLGIIFLLGFSCAGSPAGETLPDESLTEQPVPEEAGALADEPSILVQAPEPIPPPEEPDRAIGRSEVEIPPDDFLPDLPEITLPPEQQEDAALSLVLPEPPPFEFPAPEEALVFAEPEPMEPPASIEPDLPDFEVEPLIIAEQPQPEPLDQEPAAPPVREAPPEPPPFIRLPEREIAAAPEPEPPVPEFTLPDPPVAAPNLEEETIVFSRVIRALAGQLIEIPFRGAGWVYLGELGSRRGVSYESRRLDPEGQTFVFRAEIPDTYILKFYRRDFIRDYELNDYVQVIVGEAAGVSDNAPGFGPPVDRGRVTAEPRWPLIDSPGASVPSFPGAADEGEIVQTDSPFFIPEEDPAALSAAGSGPESPGLSLADPEDYVRRAKEDFDAGRIVSALSALDEMERFYPGMNDEALWLYAQLLEANSPNRDIRLALDCYRRLIREFPQSFRIPEAQQRIAYLERYYFNIQ